MNLRTATDEIGGPAPTAIHRDPSARGKKRPSTILPAVDQRPCRRQYADRAGRRSSVWRQIAWPLARRDGEPGQEPGEEARAAGGWLRPRIVRAPYRPSSSWLNRSGLESPPAR